MDYTDIAVCESPEREVRFTRGETRVIVDGLCLIQHGLPIRLESVASSELLLFETVEGTP